jgi:hypothetical protein
MAQGLMRGKTTKLKDDDRNIAVLMRAYHGASLESVWTDGKFVEPVK